MHVVTLGNLARLYLAQYTVEGTHTHRAKRRDLIKFLAKLQESYEIPLLSHFTPSISAAYRDSRLSEGAAPATVARELATLRDFAQKLVQHYGIKNPMIGVRDPELMQQDPKHLSDNQVETMFKIAASYGDSPFQRLRNLCAINLLLETGMRASEGLSLNLKQVDFKLKEIQQIKGKGNKYFTSFITPNLGVALRDYLEIRASRLDAEFEPLLISFYEGPQRWSYEGLQNQLQEIGNLCGFRLHAHLLRHTAAYRLYQKTKDVRLVQMYLRHSDINTSMKYGKPRHEELRRALNE